MPESKTPDVTAEDRPPGAESATDDSDRGDPLSREEPAEDGDGQGSVTGDTTEEDDTETATAPEGLRLYGEIVAVERISAETVPETFPVAIWTDETLAVELEFSGYDGRERTYFSLPETDEDDRLATLLASNEVTDPDELVGRRVLVDVEAGHPVLVARETGRRGDSRAFYGVLAGIAPSFVFTLLSFFGLADATLSLVPFVLYLLCTFVLLPPSLYIDAWYLRTTTDWEGRPHRWALLSLVPVLNIAVVPYYLITRENSRPLAPDPAGV